MRYSKFAGLTLAGVYVDQPEEIRYDFYTTLKARLSQPGHPHQMPLTPNPPHHDHWVAKEFPEDNTHADHRYIRTTVYDNRVALGEAYIQALATAILVGDRRTGRSLVSGQFRRCLSDTAVGGGGQARRRSRDKSIRY